MELHLTQKMIKDMCGAVSFKRGDSFYRAGKVKINKYNDNRCEATVKGTENFYVTIDKDEGGGIQIACSCPKLASVKNDCQHIAAVLLAIYERQRQRTELKQNNVLTEGLLRLFNDQPVRSSGEQLHFENRQVLAAEFICKPVDMGMGSWMMGVGVKIGPVLVQDIRGFLERVEAGRSCELSTLFTYDPEIHCFQKETDDVIQELIQVRQDEKTSLRTVSDHSDEYMLLIPSSSWDRLLPHLNMAPFVKLVYGGTMFDGLRVSIEILPLQFDFEESGRSSYRLRINGMDRLLVMELYRAVLFDGRYIQLKEEDCKRLMELKQMLETTGTDEIPISSNQVDFFLEKVIPGLKKVGNVRISEAIANRLVRAPLIAKLYLDRVKNRLLAGLEFHYEKIVINPLEGREPPASIMLIRDEEKEEAILQLMEASSFGKTDGGYFLQNEELEFEFLCYTVPKLEKLVQIYATTAVRNRIFRENARPQIRVRVKKERTNWLEFKFEMDGIPEQQIRDILQALEEKRRYYRLRNGSLLSLETREFKEIQRFLRAVPAQDEDLESGLNVPIVQGLRLLDSAEGSKALTIEESFKQFLESLRNPESLEYEVPERLEPILREYQKQGFKWMKTLAGFGFGGILADDMGLGKTLQSIAFILSELSDIREKRKPVLIVCPSSLTYNWLSELMKFTPEIEALVMDGSKAERAQLQKACMDMDVIITSYPLLRRDMKWYEKQTFHTVFFDEAQAFKNPITQTARAVKRIQANYRFALTGTPIENSLEELWSIFHVVFPELFMGLQEYSHLSKKIISRRIRPFLLRRLKEDVLAELPEKTEAVESVELLPDQKKLYAAYLAKLRHDTLKHLDKNTLRKNRIRILAGLTRLRQICCHPALFVDGYKGSSAKFLQLMQLIEEARLSGRRVLIFSQFTKMLSLIGRELTLQGLPFFYLDGQTPSEERVDLCNQFNAGERHFFLISLKAGGTGLNLTGADTVILYDLWWNPAVEEQAADRAHRFGQTKTVQVIKLISRGTIEEKVNELQEKKRHLIEEVIESKEGVMSALTDEDIREILGV
ncbi:DEAD/DEAH box helicase [Bacillus sp. DTU_2020_1000418_1_SI_GHA_SEK_038]|uniref:DEAD/DEAH box helicase n=1 Tax=Bacillus sp. DTU_2020_1000418_1_SI_GHA_SEK_038 TaxID=3077585 RepID=UPI0028E1F65A|nr:DEAD/DEAH box helicase [Bacillus sp. DTU_2020_1000418_1_SI_GHA_SEK_038]WNS75384.1 DEAD/DEAH box helicase [Bacillus sp. DTU_2020_1000418_1_SI_GHA_SEK_038]